jgi:predicted DNA repair protein MutK
MVKGAVRTDFILSAEIMAIALNEVKGLAETSIWLEAGVLVVVAIGITITVYGVVGLIVKMDDIGLHMAKRKNGASQAIGRGLVKAMPKLMSFLSIVGTAAMLWVGGQIIVHGFGLHPADWVDLHQGAAAWIADATISGVIGLAIGAVIVGIHHLWMARKSA